MKAYLEEIEAGMARFLEKDTEEIVNIAEAEIDGELIVGKWYSLSKDNNGRYTATVDETESGKRLKKAEDIRNRLKNK